MQTFLTNTAKKSKFSSQQTYDKILLLRLVVDNI